MKETYLLYGNSKIKFQVPDSIDILELKDSPNIENIDKVIEKSLCNPIGTKSLSSLIKEKKPRTAAVTISDITRAVPNPVFLPHLLRTLEKGGIQRKNIIIVVGTGMHRQSTKSEHIHLVGAHIYKNYRVIDHIAGDGRNLTKVCEDPPVSVNSNFLRADFKIVTGFIEPHFMAGYSGGRKGVCPALVDLKTIQKFHGYETLSSPLAMEGILEGNPCHETALKVAKTADVDFLFNVALNRNLRISEIFCGDLEEAHICGCDYVSAQATCFIDHSYDLAVTCAGGFPLDINYYQSVKGMCMALPALKQGGSLFQISECREGVGSKPFQDILHSYKNRWKDFLRDIEINKNITKQDQWEFQMLCRVLNITGTKHLYFFQEGRSLLEGGLLEGLIHCSPVLMGKSISETVGNFIHTYLKSHKQAQIAVIPTGPYTILRRR